MRYTKEQISAALLLLDATGSPATVIETLGYPSNSMLYHWKKKYPEFCFTPQQRHWKQASTDLKMDVIRRCFVDGESVQSVSEEVGYTPSMIYKWYRKVFTVHNDGSYETLNQLYQNQYAHKILKVLDGGFFAIARSYINTLKWYLESLILQ